MRHAFVNFDVDVHVGGSGALTQAAGVVLQDLEGGFERRIDQRVGTRERLLGIPTLPNLDLQRRRAFDHPRSGEERLPFLERDHGYRRKRAFPDAGDGDGARGHSNRS